ncbi:MAG: hypothetical protein ACKVOL_06115 [Novosphingobium sp.]
MMMSNESQHGAFSAATDAALAIKLQACFSMQPLSGGGMLPYTRAMVAASAHAFIFGKKVAGVHDHATGQDLQIAVEVRGDRMQGFDGDRSAKFTGTLPELYDAGDDAFVSLEIDGMTARGYDRGSSSHYSLTADGQVVQLYDYAAEAWFAYSIQTL